MYAAINPTAAMPVQTITITKGSRGPIPYSMLFRIDADAKAEMLPMRDAPKQQNGGIPQNHPEYQYALRPERHPNPDFACPPRDGVRHDPVKAHDGEHERQSGKCADQHHGEARLGKLQRHEFVHGPDLRYRDVLDPFRRRCVARWLPNLSGRASVRTTVYRQHQVFSCDEGRYICGSISRSVAYSFMLPTTPTISRQGGPPGVPLPAPGFSLFPKTCSPGKNFCANAWFTIMTCWELPSSRSLKSRPCRTGICMVLKYSGVIGVRWARRLVAFRNRMFWIFKADYDPIVRHGEHHHPSRRLHAGQRTHLFKIRSIELGTNLCVLCIRHFEIHGGQMVGIESFIRMNQPVETADKQSSRSRQQQAHCDLSDD